MKSDETTPTNAYQHRRHSSQKEQCCPPSGIYSPMGGWEYVRSLHSIYKSYKFLV